MGVPRVCVSTKPGALERDFSSSLLLLWCQLVSESLSPPEWLVLRSSPHSVPPVCLGGLLPWSITVTHQLCFWLWPSSIIILSQPLLSCPALTQSAPPRLHAQAGLGLPVPVSVLLLGHVDLTRLTFTLISFPPLYKFPGLFMCGFAI